MDSPPEAIGSGRRAQRVADYAGPAERLEDLIRKAIQDDIAQETEAVVASAVKDFEQRLRQRIAQGACEISGFYDVERQGDRLIISVKVSG